MKILRAKKVFIIFIILFFGCVTTPQSDVDKGTTVDWDKIKNQIPSFQVWDSMRRMIITCRLSTLRDVVDQMADISLQKDSRWADYFYVINFIAKTLYPSIPFPRGYFEAESIYFKEAVINFSQGKAVIRETDDDLMMAVYCLYPLIPGTTQISPAVLALMDEIEKKYPASILPVLVKAKFYLGVKDYSEAQNYFTMVKLLDPECIPASIGMAQIAFDRGNYSAAAELLDSVWKQISPTEAGYTLWVDLSMKAGNYAQALSRIETALASYSSSSTLMVKKSLILLYLKEWERLDQFFPRIALFDGLYPEVLLIKGLLALQKVGGLSEAESCLKRGRALFPEYEDFRFLEGRIAFVSGDFENGSKILLSSETVMLDQELTHLAVFEAGIQTGHFTEAAESLSKIDLSRQNAEFFTKAAKACLYAGDYDQAVMMVQKLLKKEDTPDNHYLLIEALSRQGKDTTIPAQIDKALADKELFPVHKGKLLLAKSLWYTDSASKIALLQSARSVDPFNPDVLYELALLEIRASRVYQAWFLLKQLVESVPDYPGAKKAFEGLNADFFGEN